jgi:hypothetical protein
MPVPTNTAVFYVVFVAPGFVAVMTVITLAAIEDDYSSFVLLIWSLVASLVIDTVFVAVYQHQVQPIESFDQLPDILFDPYFQAWYVLGILFASFVVGVGASIVILLDAPGWLRRLLQLKSNIKVNPRQPWANFMHDAGWVRFKTSDNQLYMGLVTEWSRAERPKEVWIKSPQRYNSDTKEFEPVDSEKDTEMLFLEKDIDRIVMVSRDTLPPVRKRIWTWIVERLPYSNHVTSLWRNCSDRVTALWRNL